MADFEAQQLQVSEFIGGPTDFPLDGAPSEYEKAENLGFTPTKKLITRPGSDIFNDTVFQVPAGSQRIGSLISNGDDLLVQSGRNIYVAGSSSWTTITNPNPALTEGDTTNFISHGIWNDHVIVCSDAYAKPVKIYNDATSGYVVRTAGLPALSAPGLAGTAGANSYLYALTYSYTYTIGDLTFEDEGPTVLAQISSIDAPDSNSITVSGIDVLSNGSTDNYDTANIVVRVYRTQNNGTIFFKVAEITNGTTSYVDSTSDTTLANNVVLYTTGGVVDNDPPPRAKYTHVVNGTTYYANVKEGSSIDPTKVMQSVAGDPDSVPVTFFTQTDENITGISSFNSNPIVFTKNKIYRIEGFFDAVGGGGMFAEEFSETIGSLNHNGIVQTRMGLFFPGNDGFYWTDGYRVQRVSRKIFKRYRDATADQDQKDKIYGTYDRENDVVYWSMLSTTAATDNDTLYALDLRWGLRENSAITTWVGGTSFVPTAITFHARKLHRGDSRGYLFFHDDTLLTDKKVDVSVAPSLWNRQAILYEYLSTSVNFGLPQTRKWVNKLLLSVKSEANVSALIESNNDDSNNLKELVEVKDISQLVWGDNSIVWGTVDDVGRPFWDVVNLVEQKRRFPAGSMRCSHKQIRITNAMTNIWNSDKFESATVDGTAKTATLPTLEWTTDVVDYFISFEDDGYTEEYQILSIAAGVLTFDVTSLQTAPADGTSKWIIKGKAKGQVLHMLGYIIYWTPISKSFAVYQGEIGGNT